MFLNSSFGKSMVAAKAVGAAQKHFNVGAAKDVDFSFPPIAEQQALVERSKEVRTTVGNLEKRYRSELANIADLRQSLLRSAFAGELN